MAQAAQQPQTAVQTSLFLIFRKSLWTVIYGLNAVIIRVQRYEKKKTWGKKYDNRGREGEVRVKR